MGKMRLGLVVLLALALGTVVVATGSARPNLPEAGTANKRTVTPDVAGFAKQHGPFSNVECTTTAANGTPATNILLDCDEPLPNNEPDIEAAPWDPNLLVASSNDYGSCCDEWYTSKDGGATWTEGNISREAPDRTGSDPVTVFSRKHGTIIHSSLNYRTHHAGGTQTCDGDLVVSISRDGIAWDRPVVVDTGLGCDLQKSQLFNDKEWIVADNYNDGSPLYGRVYLTWTKFVSADGSTVESPIYESHSDDGGFSWSAAKRISGSNAALCTFPGPDNDPGECDENQFSVPVVLPNHHVAVAFENDQNTALWDGKANEFDDQYLVVRSTDGGGTWSAPVMAAAIEDGASDYPLNVRGRQTLTGYQVRVNSAGNIAAHPGTGKLAIVYSDNSAGTAASTNTEVWVTYSSNEGTSWSAPVKVDTGTKDEWFPWAEFSPTTGKLGVVYHSRRAADPDLYDTKLAIEGATPSTFAGSVVSSKPSNPTESLFFKAGDEAEGCEDCATFHGDYNNIAYDSLGRAHLVWTDMSTFVTDGPFGTGFSQGIAYARR